MSCQDIQGQLKHFFEDLLTENEYQEVCEHLSHCAQCRRYASSTGSLSYLLKELGEMDVPRDLAETIRFRLANITEKAAAGAPAADTRKASASWYMKILGTALVAVAVIGFFVTGNRGKSGTPPQVVMESDSGQEEVTVIKKIEPPEQAPVSDEEAEQLYKQLQTMATSLEQITASKADKKQVAETEPAQDDVVEVDPKAAMPAAGGDVAQPGAFHWHIPYVRDAERSQLISTVNILDIKVDYEDRDFLVFKATGNQLKQLIAGIEFANKADLEAPDFILDGSLVDTVIPASMYFIGPDVFNGRADAMPMKRKDGVFVSNPPTVMDANNVIDWHFLIIPGQREKVLDAVHLVGGRILYASDEALVFTVLGARIRRLMDEVSGIGGVFADFGQAELSESVLLREMVKVLVTFKEQ